MPRCTCIASDYGLMCILWNALLSPYAVYALSKLYDISGDVSRIARFVQCRDLRATCRPNIILYGHAQVLLMRVSSLSLMLSTSTKLKVMRLNIEKLQQL